MDTSSRHPPDSKMKSATIVKNSEVKSNEATTSSISMASSSKVRERKVYSLPGQKYDPPEQKDPLRIFYESLSKQIPTSEMAEFWLMEHGLLSPEKAKIAFEKKQRKTKQLRTGTPVVKLSNLPSKTHSSSQKPKNHADIKGKEIMVNEIDDDDDFFFLSHRRRRLLQQ